MQSVVKEQQKRVSALEAELKAKDSEYGGLQAKLVELQVTSPCFVAPALFVISCGAQHNTNWTQLASTTACPGQLLQTCSADCLPY